jgi:predicted esterase
MHGAENLLESSVNDFSSRVCRIYTISMPKLILFCAALAVFSVQATAQQTSSPVTSVASQDLQTGVIIAKVSSATQPDQSYALYIPSHYTREKQWPIVYAFDPGARGSVPVELMKDAAERYGYIVAGSNNSQNGPVKSSSEAAQAMFQDTHARLSIDDKRIYFAGLSGGARLVASLAQVCKCAAGVLMNSAGFSPSFPPVAGANFSVFGTAGAFDFNYPEVVNLDAKLATLHYAHAFSGFDGSHDWAPAGVMDEALAWFRLIAMKQDREPRDAAFVNEQSAEVEKRAKALEAAGDPYASWKQYRQAAETFDGLSDATPFRERAAALEKVKAVRDGAKREQQDFEDQSTLSADIESGLASLRQYANRAELRAQLEDQIYQLRIRTEREKNPQKLRVERRALSGIFVGAMEAGEGRLDAKDVSAARAYFELASVADPDSVWALREVAVTRASDDNRKGALEALRRAKEKTKDPAAFSAWLKDEPAFAKFSDTPEFRALLAPAQGPARQ